MVVFLCIVVGLTLLLCIPLAVHVRAGEDTEVAIHWLFLRFRVYPERKKPEKPKKQGRTKKKSPEQAEKKKLFSGMELSELAALAMEAVQSAGRFLRAVLRNVRVRGLLVQAYVAGEDAAGTAMAYGRLQAVLTTALGILQGYLKIIRPTLDIRPDFLGEKSVYRVRFRAVFTPLIVLGALLRAAASLLLSFLRHTGGKPDGKAQQQKNTGAPRPELQKECTANE